ncbi:phosphate acyltransferase [Zhongshania sp.]|uniref:phosphate acyltransferase n=1 Tax=Zhongshania sp. TaxID=1971902 RepID=UPI003562BBAE
MAYKIVERIGGENAIGRVLQGFAKPRMDLSCGSSAEDVADVAVIAAVLAK